MFVRVTRPLIFVLVALAFFTLSAYTLLAQDSSPAAPAGGTVPPLPADIYLPLIENGTPPAPTLVASASAGDEFACALSTAGDVSCWGWHTVDAWVEMLPQFDVAPVPVAGIEDVQQISAGMVHACALLADKSVACWGDNLYGQLGSGNNEPSLSPVIVPNLTSVTHVEAGTRGTCVLLDNGSVQCWGTMILREDEEFVDHHFAVPTQVEGLEEGVAAISMRGLHGCALMENGSVKCWGPNARGALGDGTLNDSLAAVDVAGLPDGIVAISAGIQRTCAITAEGGVKCWGSNEYNNLGDGSDVAYSLTPVDVVGLDSGVRSVDVNYYRTRAVKQDDTVWCWGMGAPLGDGVSLESPTPVQVADMGNAEQVTSGRYFSCAVTAAQSVRCWGGNHYGQLGNGTTLDAPLPTRVVGTGG